MMKVSSCSLIAAIMLTGCNSQSTPPRVEFSNSRPISVIIDGVKLKVTACTKSADVLSTAQEWIDIFEQSKWLKLGFSRVNEVCLTEPKWNIESAILLTSTGVYFTVKGARKVEYNDIHLAPQSI